MARADAERNYDRLLTEAETMFREQGTGASLEAIARRAGVASGTLYGHFPNRRMLIAVVLRDRNAELFATDKRLAAMSPTQALCRWIELVTVHVRRYRGMAQFLADGLDDAASELHESCAKMTTIGERLITDAVAAGELRSEVTGADLLTLINAAAWTSEHTSAELAQRLVDYAIDGMRRNASATP